MYNIINKSCVKLARQKIIRFNIITNRDIIKRIDTLEQQIDQNNQKLKYNINEIVLDNRPFVGCNLLQKSLYL